MHLHMPVCLHPRLSHTHPPNSSSAPTDNKQTQPGAHINSVPTYLGTQHINTTSAAEQSKLGWPWLSWSDANIDRPSKSSIPANLSLSYHTLLLSALCAWALVSLLSPLAGLGSGREGVCLAAWLGRSVHGVIHFLSHRSLLKRTRKPQAPRAHSPAAPAWLGSVLERTKGPSWGPSNLLCRWGLFKVRTGEGRISWKG